MGATLMQLFPGRPAFTEEHIPSLAGKVFLVTGGNAGVGLEVVKILYAKGGTVYIAGRSPSRVAAEIETIKSIPTATPGHLKSLQLDLADLTTIANCVTTFLAQESRLDVLFNNAGIGVTSAISTTVQGHEARMGTNCIGPFLLTQLLLPILRRTAETSPKAGVRVVFTTSGVMDLVSIPGGLSLDELAPGNHSKDRDHNYRVSKVGDWFLASEFDKRIRKDGILCVAQSPGTLKTKGWDAASFLTRAMMAPFMHEPKMGAYTELWCGLSPELTLEDGGRLAIPWGRWHPSPRKDMLESMKTKDEGGTGLAAEFWAWCEEETKQYAGN